MMKSIISITLGLSLSALADWTSDYPVALEKAKKENKDLILNFSGSDWNAWCAKQKLNVFDKEEFIKKASEKYVLVSVDFPLHIKLSDEEKAKREALKKRFKVKGYPTVLLVSSDEKPYMKLSYREVTPTQYIKLLENSFAVKRGRDAAFSAADKQEGMERAKSLSKGLSGMEKTLADTYYSDRFEQLKTLDPEDTLEFFQKRELGPLWRTEMKKLQARFQKKEYDQIDQEIDAFISEHEPKGLMLQEIMTGKLYTASNRRDMQQVNEIAEKIKALNSQSPWSQRVDKLIERLNQIVENEKAAQEKPKIMQQESKK